MITKTLKIGLFVIAISSFSFVGAQEKLKQNKPNSDRMFKHLDANGNGSITIEEYKTKRLKDESKTVQIEKRFTEMDTDKNGSVDSAEFKVFFEGERARTKNATQKEIPRKG